MKNQHSYFLFFLLPFTTAAQGDLIITTQEKYPSATVVGFEEGKVYFRTNDDMLHEVRIQDVGLFHIDSESVFDDFNQAEKFLHQNQTQRALIRYRRALLPSQDFWKELIAARFLMACDRAGHLDAATRNLIVLSKGSWGGVSSACQLIPQQIPHEKTRRTSRSIEHLDAALFKRPPLTQRVLWEYFRYKILHETSDDRAVDSAVKIARMPIPPELRYEELYRIKLSAIESALAKEITPGLITSLDEGIRLAPDSVVAGYLIVRGEVLLKSANSQAEIIRATWPLMRAAIHFPESPQAAKGLYLASTAMTKLSRKVQALQLLEECLNHDQITDDLRTRAEMDKQKLSAAEGSSSD